MKSRDEISTNKFLKLVTSLKVIFDSLGEVNRELILDSLNNNPYKKFLKKETFDIFNIGRCSNRTDYFYYRIENQNNPDQFILLSYKDLEKIKNNIQVLFNQN